MPEEDISSVEQSAQTVEELAAQETFGAFGEGWEPAADFDDTNKRIRNHLAIDRPNVPPSAIQPFECRIGASKFFVPPLSISVNQRFKSGSLVGGALRQQNTPKFNSGNMETVIQMSIYFPTVETVWGVENFRFDVDFDNPDIPEERIDNFLSSLRGLTAQFRYAPFLPIKNTYLNQVFGITGVALKDMSISTVPNFPFCMAVTLTLYKFNHKTFLPMIDDFDQAIHWGRFRQYMGRAAVRMANASNTQKIFQEGVDSIGEPQGTIDPSLNTAEGLLEKYAPPPLNQSSLFKLNEATASRLDLYFPFFTPSRVELPDLSDMKYQPLVQVRSRNWWEKLMGIVGFNPDIYEDSHYDAARNAAEQGKDYRSERDDVAVLWDFIKAMNLTVDTMGPSQMNAYMEQRVAETGLDPNSAAAAEVRTRVRSAWFAVMYRMFLENPGTAAALANEDKRRRQLTIDEWEVPMWRLGGQEGLNPDYVTVQGISLTMGNVLSRLQLQMQDEPTHQHIGGEDTRIEISLIIHGDRAEEYLLKFRNMFESISGLSRLEHGHGVIGFLGIRNPITELAGVSHTVPINFSVDTVENMPHVYRVTISLVDFDVFQQRREALTVEQQAELVEAFGKRNPMLRVKQLWGMFNAYPDFPLSVRDDDNRVVGHLDPDYYFRSFKSIDDDIVDPVHRTPPGERARRPQPQQQAQSNGGSLRDQIDALTTEEPDQVDNGEGAVAAGVNMDFLEQPGLHVCVGSVDGDPQYITVDDDGFSIQDGATRLVDKQPYQEMHAGAISKPQVEGTTPPSGYIEPYYGGSSDPRANFDTMAKDLQYRDKSGRMVRAFPTYMLWLIDEGGNFAGMKLFNNFYGLQSVIDMSIVRSEDIMADTIMLRVSNLYNKLTTQFKDYFEADEVEGDVSANVINQLTTKNLRIASGIGDYLVDLETIRLKPGVRLHLRLGYGSNPNSLETVFNGTVTEVQEGDILTIVAQSDAVEFGSMVNNTNEKGHTGKIDGSYTGLYMSEPRDLIISLLTQGSSVVKEAIAHASQGEIFSENRYGIRHFGTMMYTPMSTEEQEKQGRQRRLLSNRILGGMEGASSGGAQAAGVAGNATLGAATGNSGAGTAAKDSLFTATTMVAVLNDAFVNLSTKRDYEVFKRNVYPGNGTGIAQFMGGDMGDIVANEATVQSRTGVDQDGTGPFIDPMTGEEVDTTDADQLEQALRQQSGGTDPLITYNEDGTVATYAAGPAPPNPTLRGLEKPGEIINNFFYNFWKGTGLAHDGDVDQTEEVSFRAQTYMKTVWDLFKVCAALLPDYIIAVRPFEERSTVFYGKPHWLYTSGVIPLTSGSGKATYAPPDEEFRDIYQRLEMEYAKRDETFGDDIIGAARSLNPDNNSNSPSSSDPTLSTEGMAWTDDPESILSSPLMKTQRPDGVGLPHTEGPIGIEMHIPTSENLQEDIVNQASSNSMLPPRYQHPFYMDRKGGGRGGVSGHNEFNPRESILEQTQMAGENPNDAGEPGYMEYLDPESERWYMCQYWTDRSWTEGQKWKGMKILIYNASNKKAVVCTPGDKGPHPDASVIAGCSPEAYLALGEPSRSDPNIHYRIMPDNTPLGPVKFGGTPGTSFVLGEPGGASDNRLEGNGGNLETQPISTDDLPDWANGNTNLAEVSREEGGTTVGIPVNYTTKIKDGGQTVELFSDKEGQVASALYSHNRSEEAANAIWDEVRTRFPKDPMTKEIYLQLPLFEDASEDEIKDTVTDEDVQDFATEFIKFMWEDGARRGWVVKVLDKNIDLASVGPVDFDLADIGIGDKKDWNFDRLFEAFHAYVTAADADPEDAVESWIRNNNKDGSDHSNLVARGIEEAGRGVHEVADKVTGAIKAIGAIGSGVFNFLRLSLFQTSEGLTQANDMQKKANTLNKIYNDSIYFSAGVSPDGTVTNPLLYYADNPFTREYGEPVAEIREPFQRMHKISSFNHIVSNQIMENLNGVASVVTAVSNGADPVTVHFDKGMPSERQTEMTVETGLFWDDPGFWGNFNPLNWYQQGRENKLKREGSSPELSAKRIALWHLKESLKNIYGGEITVIGDASIRPYDIVYMADVYERMYGFFEVEQVVHHFTPETGFITSITPNACVTINDPGRFYFQTQKRARMSVDSVRERMRAHFDVKADKQGDMVNANDGRSDDVDISYLEAQMEETIKGSSQFYGGNSKIVDVMVGGLGGVGAGIGGLAIGGAAATGGFGIVGGILGWKAWKWVRDNLLDQHGCFISYLTKNGEPMDASLGYAEGVAVGHQHSMSLILGGVNLTEVTKSDENGNPKIRTQDVIKSIQWNEQGPNDLAKEVSLFHEATLAELRGESGRYGELIANDGGVEAYLVRVIRIIDGDTIEVSPIKVMKYGQITNYSESIGDNTIRLSGVNAYEDPYKGSPLQSELNANHLGVKATNFVKSRLMDLPIGETKTVALRVNVARPKDDYGRVLAYVFHNAPDEMTTDTERETYLLNAAGQVPLKDWDGYTSDGKPLTLDWDIVTNGHGEVEARELGNSVPGITRGESEPRGEFQ